MKKESWALVLSIVAIVISIATVFIRCETYEFDVLSWMLGFVALLVAIFTVVQIINMFTLRRDIEEQNGRFTQGIEEKVNANKKSIEEYVNDAISDYDHTISANMYQVYAISELFRRNMFKAALEYLMKALHEVNQAKRDKTPMCGIISYIGAVKEEASRFPLSQEETERYISILEETRDRNAIELISYIEFLGATQTNIDATSITPEITPNKNE